MTMADLPARIGPAEFSALGSMIAVRCPSDLDALMQRAGGLWEPGTRRWLIERRRMGPLIRNLRGRPIRCSGRQGSIWTWGEVDVAGG
jgi:hypothetical protein